MRYLKSNIFGFSSTQVSPENTMQAVNLVHAEQLESIFLDGIVVKNRLR